MTTLELVAWIATGVTIGAFTIEALISYFLLRDGHYRLGDTFTSIAIGVGYLFARFGIGALVAVVLFLVYDATPLRWSMTAWWHWGVLFLVTDFFYYWSHRASHTYPVLWASHAAHHSSPHMNLSIGLRNSWVGGAIDWVFFVPPVALGFHPLAFGAVAALAGAWDFLTHTPYVGKLRWFDGWANTPANHRVHHARNRQYVDKNLGGALIIWDRLFGTYEPEGEKPIYGIDPAPARPNNPFYLEFYLWIAWFRGLFKRKSTA
jgi:sterol desaturase/sphingolipid hydroxylase (fatty acid hydroxylase superfamily)